MAPVPTGALAGRPPLRALTLSLCVGLLAPAAPAQTEGEALDRAMADALAQAGAARPLLRCTGLFRALRLHPAAPDGSAAGAALREADLATTAAVIWQDEAGMAEIQAAFDAIVPMIGAASAVYQRRMSRNAETTGGIFDAELEDDLIYCDALHAGLAAPRGD
jgi:hypothetical protein